MKRKLKIAFLCIYSHPSICGVWTRVSNLGMILAKKGHEIHVFSTNIIKGTNKTSSHYEKFQGISIHRFKSNISFGENVKFWDPYKEIQKINPDIIIAEVYRHPHTHLALKIARELKKPCFLVTHAPFVEPELRSRIGNLIAKLYDRFFGPKTIRKFNKIITITKWEIPYLENLGIRREQLTYIPNGVPEEFFKIKTRKGKNLLFLGRISPIKNLESLIKAVAIVKKAYPNIELKIVGPAEKEYKTELENLIKKLDLEKNIKFFPAIYDIKKKIKIIDNSAIFVLPSKREAMPQSLVEAMARKKIVIASANKGAQEIIIDKKNGFLFPISSSTILAGILEYCLTKKNEKNLKQIRNNAVEKAKKFRWTKIANKFNNLILASVKEK